MGAENLREFLKSDAVKASAGTAANPRPAPATPPADKAQEKVTGIQKGLKFLGYDPGPITGVMNPATQAAISKFQKAAGLKVDGDPGPETQKALLTNLGAKATGDMALATTKAAVASARAKAKASPPSAPSPGAASKPSGIVGIGASASGSASSDDDNILGTGIHFVVDAQNAVDDLALDGLDFAADHGVIPKEQVEVIRAVDKPIQGARNAVEEKVAGAADPHSEEKTAESMKKAYEKGGGGLTGAYKAAKTLDPTENLGEHVVKTADALEKRDYTEAGKQAMNVVMDAAETVAAVVGGVEFVEGVTAEGARALEVQAGEVLAGERPGKCLGRTVRRCLQAMRLLPAGREARSSHWQRRRNRSIHGPKPSRNRSMPSPNRQWRRTPLPK
jgi:hypothetical protein